MIKTRGLSSRSWLVALLLCVLCPTLLMAQLGIPTRPVTTEPPLDQNVEEGGTATFTVGVKTFLKPSYQWQKDEVDLEDGGSISGSTPGMLTISNVTTNDLGLYRVQVSNVMGTRTSDAASLTQPGAAEVGTRPPQLASILHAPLFRLSTSRQERCPH
jgi:hypothetical protein